MTNRRLFLFGIGGTGSRVIKALTFLLASGVKAEASQIIPIIIDPDRENGDLNRTIEILQNYQKVRQQVSHPDNGFFQTEIRTLASLENTPGTVSQVSQGFNFSIDGTRDGKFRDFIQYDHLDESNKRFVNLLFADQLLNSELGVGFKGNPNMGSVVLNQLKNMEDFRYFANLFKEDDRIFIVSSIFGGTGAAGFPLLVKNMREPEISNLANQAFLKNARIGAVTLLPYFGVEESEKSAIQKTSFITKTKAALNYYRNGVNKSLNALYYLGDRYTKDYKNYEGKGEQKNDAHLVEMIAALSVLDFLKLSDAELKNTNGKVDNPRFFEYGMRGETPKTDFTTLGLKTKTEIARSLTQYTYCCKYWEEQLPNSLGQQAWSKGKGGKSNVNFDRSFLTSPFYDSYLKPFNARYLEWLREMGGNLRGFAPFDLDTRHLHNLVTNVQQKSVGLIMRRVEWDYNFFEDALNKEEMGQTQMEATQKFATLFYNASNRIFDAKLEERI